MTVKLWLLGSLALAVLLPAAFYLGSSTMASATPVVSQRQQAYEIALQQAQDLVSARLFRASQPQPARATAISHVRWAIPDVESYNADNVHGNPFDPDLVSSGPIGPDHGTTDSGYTGMTVPLLTRIYDRGLAQWAIWVNPADPGYPARVTGVVPNTSHYCVIARSGDWYAWKLGPGGSILVTQSPSAVCQTVRVIR